MRVIWSVLNLHRHFFPKVPTTRVFPVLTPNLKPWSRIRASNIKDFESVGSGKPYASETFNVTPSH